MSYKQASAHVQYNGFIEVLSKVVSSARGIAGIFRSLMLISLFTAFSSDIKSLKLKKNLHSLYNIAVNPKCMMPVTNAMIWKRMILPTGLCACEIYETVSYVS
jgi:hypothetical protein